MNEPNKLDINKEKDLINSDNHLIIWGLANTIAPKYVFANYTKEDLVQEAYMMGMDALTRYDGLRPLRNFIANHMSNRLKTFKRDHYYRPNAGTAEYLQSAKRAIMSPGDIDKVNKKYEIDYEGLISISENKEILDALIPIIHRRNYLRMLAGIKISQTRKKEIIIIIRENLGDIYVG